MSIRNVFSHQTHMMKIQNYCVKCVKSAENYCAFMEICNSSCI